MLQRSVVAALFVLAAITLSASASDAPTGATVSGAPTLFVLEGVPQTLAGGAQQVWKVKLDENQAMDAVFTGGLWLPDGAGGRIHLRYVRHILHGDGTWTWIGKVATAHGEQSAVITFGKGAVFGRIPQSNGYPLRLITQHGEISLLRTSGDIISRSATAVAMRASNDARALPRRRPATGSAPAAADAQKQQTIAAAVTAANPVIDVMVAYTPGIVSEYGSTSAAVTRINNLVDIANQAYADSKVNQSIRLVDTVQVDYPDDTSNDSALDDLTGYDSNGNPVKIPSSLQGIAGLRSQHGADLVSLLRAYDNATNGGCGLAWIIGGNETPIVPAQDNIYGYSVVGDGSDGGFFCLDTSFAHELGHNMGDAHDRANADNPGAYPYSYGYLGNGTNGFATIMAYGSPTQTPLAVFSNPDISICQNTPCGVADTASNSADNAHSMNNTASLIAQFEPTASSTKKKATHNDVNGDGKSDILFFNPTSSGLVYWLMNGSHFVSYNGYSVASGYQPVGTGDFDGNGMTDILWNGNGTLYVWLNNGSGGFTSEPVTAYPGGWQLVGCRDVDGDGQDDILWYHPGLHQFVYWVMSGAGLILQHEVNVTPGFASIGAGDFNGDGRADVAWRDASGRVYVWIGNGVSFTQYQVNVTADSSWMAGGIGDADGNGKSDLYWYQPSNGNVQYWLMNAATVVGYKIFNTGQGYTFAGLGDFDGDGRADILWSRNNVLSMWLHYDPYNYYGTTVQPYATGWNVLP